MTQTQGSENWNPPTSAELRHDLRERVAYLEHELKNANDRIERGIAAHLTRD